MQHPTVAERIANLPPGGSADFEDLGLLVRREPDGRTITVRHNTQVIAMLESGYKAAALVDGLRGVAAALHVELVKDLQDGVFPASVSSYDELHDHFDANMLTEGRLKGLHISKGAPDNEEAWCGAMNAVSHSINRELASGRIREAAGESGLSPSRSL